MISRLIVAFINAYTLMIFVYVVLSWFPTKRGLLLDVNDFLARFCEPYLALFRRFIPPVAGSIDFSPLAAIFVLNIAEQLAIGLLRVLFI